ncbi:MAG: transposase [Planctomycetes bacterium]|nr:transposase [Planctomycetota bacterium]
MPRQKRIDYPGAWFHVMNRAIARRTMFENSVDAGFFLDRIGEAVERGWLEVHSYSLMGTHFHALVRSPSGALSCALRDIQRDYVRHFNRSRRRDGPLVRGRFRSRPVDCLVYRRVLVSYIDANAPRAGLARSPGEHPFGSCRAYLTGEGPAWLERAWVESEVRYVTGNREFTATRYAATFHHEFPDGDWSLVERRLAAGASEGFAIDTLLDGSSPAARDWLRERATLADGTRPGLAIVPANAVGDAIAAVGTATGDTTDPPSDRVAAAHALLLRELAGLPFRLIARRLGRSTEAARQLFRAARAVTTENDEFATFAAEIGDRALRRTYAPWLRRQPQNAISIAARHVI